MWYRSLLLVVGLLVPVAAAAQRPAGTDGVWMTLGAGAVNGSDGVDLHASYSFARQQTAFQLAYDYTGALWGGDDWASTLSAGIGRRTTGRAFLMAQFVGPALTYRVREPAEVLVPPGVPYPFQPSRRLHPGLAANAQFYVKPLAFVLPEVGVGMEVFGNLNMVQTFYGLRLSLVVHNTL